MATTPELVKLGPAGPSSSIKSDRRRPVTVVLRQEILFVLVCHALSTACQLSIISEYIGRFHPEYSQKRSDAGERTDTHHGRSIPEEQRGMSRHGADTHVGVAHRHRDQGPHRQAGII